MPFISHPLFTCQFFTQQSTCNSRKGGALQGSGGLSASDPHGAAWSTALRRSGQFSKHSPRPLLLIDQPAACSTSGASCSSSAADCCEFGPDETGAASEAPPLGAHLTSPAAAIHTSSTHSTTLPAPSPAPACLISRRQPELEFECRPQTSQSQALFADLHRCTRTCTACPSGPCGARQRETAAQ